MSVLTVGELFAGIGGFGLGLERAGMRVLWQSEIDGYCQRVLAKHWPDVLRVPDVRDINADSVPAVDVLCGGFPCQDLSVAGRGAGLDGERSGLWREFARLIGELRPRYVIAENVAALTSRGLDRCLADLAARGFDAEWDCLPAAAFGAPHRRDRVWLVAYPNNSERVAGTGHLGPAGRHESRDRRAMAHPARGGSSAPRTHEGGSLGSGWLGGSGRQWLTEPDVGRVAHGVPARVDRLRSLGNALVPQIAEWIGTRILEWEGEHVTEMAA